MLDIKIKNNQSEKNNQEVEQNTNNSQQNSQENSYNIELNSFRTTSFFLSEEAYAENISYDQLKTYIKYPMIYNKILRMISKLAYNENGLYANVIDYCVAIPTLNWITTMRKKTGKSKKTKKEFNLLLKKINHERTTRDILKHLFVDGMYVGIFRNTKSSNKNVTPQVGLLDGLDKLEGLSIDENIMIQPLNLDYCKIIGFQQNANVAAFDMMYFDQFKHGGLLNEIKNFPKEFLTAYNEYRKDASKRWFILDPKKTFALKFKANEIEAYGRPYGLSAFTKMKFSDDYEASQYNLINELASSIYYLILPEGDIKGKCSLNKDQQENVIRTFEGAVKINTGGNRAKISNLTLPPGAEIGRLSKDSALLKDTLSEENIKKISTHLGFASSALNASSEGGASYSSLQVNIDLILSQLFQCIDDIAVEYTRILNQSDIINNNNPDEYIDFKYLKISYLNQDKMYNRAKELYLQGMGSLKYWIATAGFDPDDYISMMEEELEEGIFDKFKPHMTSFTTNGDDLNNQGGRPEKDEKDLTIQGQATKNSGGNKKPKPSTSE